VVRVPNNKLQLFFSWTKIQHIHPQSLLETSTHTNINICIYNIYIYILYIIYIILYIYIYIISIYNMIYIDLYRFLICPYIWFQSNSNLYLYMSRSSQGLPLQSLQQQTPVSINFHKPWIAVGWSWLIYIEQESFRD
jgi:hypothetical protein